MPEITRQAVRAVAPQPTFNGDVDDVLGSILPATQIKPGQRCVCLYGRNRLGKSTLACQFAKPLLLMACEPASNGGADSVIGMEGVSIQQVALHHLIDPKTGKKERLKGTEKLLATANRLADISKQAGRCPFTSVVVDTMTAVSDIRLAEIMGWESCATMVNIGDVSIHTWRQLSDDLRKVMRAYKELPCENVIFVCQEKDHNKEKMEDRKQSILVQPMQERSFMAAALGGATVQWLHDAAGYICQLYMDAEGNMETVTPMEQPDGTVQNITTSVWSNKPVRRLRCVYHPNYAGGFRSPNPNAVPEYIQAKTPQDMHAAILEVMAGKRTKFGFYPNG